MGSGPSRSFFVFIGKLPVEEQRLARPQHQIPVHDDANRQARPNGQRRLDVHVAPGDLLTHLIDAVLGAVAPRDDDAVAVLAVLWRGQLGAYAQQRRQHGARDDAIPCQSTSSSRPA